MTVAVSEGAPPPTWSFWAGGEEAEATVGEAAEVGTLEAAGLLRDDRPRLGLGVAAEESAIWAVCFAVGRG